MLIIFVKNPVIHEVKTRLAAEIGAENAVFVYQKLIEYTATVVSKIDVPKLVFYGNEMPDKDIWAEMGYERQAQIGKDLGERMENAFAWAFAEGHKKCVIIGSDCAELRAEILEEAFFSLEKKDFVIGEAEDGGYYLLGMKKLFSPLFRGKMWSTNNVFKEALFEIQKGVFSLHLLPKLNDIDTLEDLNNSPFKHSF